MKPDQALSLAATHAAEFGKHVSVQKPAKSLASWVKKNPWTSAGAALLIGATLGFAIRHHPTRR